MKFLPSYLIWPATQSQQTRLVRHYKNADEFQVNNNLAIIRKSISIQKIYNVKLRYLLLPFHPCLMCKILSIRDSKPYVQINSLLVIKINYLNNSKDPIKCLFSIVIALTVRILSVNSFSGKGKNSSLLNSKVYRSKLLIWIF